MKKTTKRFTGLIAAAALAVGGSGAAFSASDQATAVYPGMMGSPRMMGGAGMMAASPADTASRLADAKRQLAITPAQDAAWNAYQQAVINQSALMNAHRQTMWNNQTPPTADQRATMHQQGWSMMQQVAQSADALYRTLTPEQRSRATGRSSGSSEPQEDSEVHMHDQRTTPPTATDPVCWMQVNADTLSHDLGRQPSPPQSTPA